MDANEAAPGNELLEIYNRILDIDSSHAREEDFLLHRLNEVRETRKLAKSQAQGQLKSYNRLSDLLSALDREEHYILDRLEYVQETRRVAEGLMSQADQLLGHKKARNQLSD